MARSREPDDFHAAEAVLREYLRDHGLKYTRERRAVLRGVMRNEHHFEAEQLLRELRSAGERVAKATLYRTLPLLVECRIVRQLQLGDKQARYEHTYGHRPHDHIICGQCGRIVEFDSAEVSRLATAVAQPRGFRVASHRFQVIGWCPECARTAAATGRAPSPHEAG